MAEYECTLCALKFESDEARCPTCLRKSGVVARGAAEREVASPAAARAARGGAPAEGSGGLATFALRLAGGLVLFFAVTFAMPVLRELPMLERLAATALGGVLLAAGWTLIAAVRRAAQGP